MLSRRELSIGSTAQLLNSIEPLINIDSKMLIFFQSPPSNTTCRIRQERVRVGNGFPENETKLCPSQPPPTHTTFIMYLLINFTQFLDYLYTSISIPNKISNCISKASFLTTVIQEYSQQALECRTKSLLSSFNKHLLTYFKRKVPSFKYLRLVLKMNWPEEPNLHFNQDRSKLGFENHDCV